MDERRAYFRISDMAFAMAAPWDNHQESIQEYFPKLRALVMQYEIDNIDKESRDLYFKIDDDVLKELVHNQNRKLELMSRYLAAYELSDQSIMPQQISIGEGGANFESHLDLNVGMDIAVAVVFTPSYLPVFAKANIVSIDNEGGQHPIIHCEFYPFPEKTRQSLMQHLLKQQTLGRSPHN